MENFLKSDESKTRRLPPLRRNPIWEFGRDVIDTFKPFQPWSAWLERMTERKEKEVDLLVGRVLVRVKIEAALREDLTDYAMLTCMVIRIDDQEINKEEREAKAATFESKERPTNEEQAAVFRQALENWGLGGKMVMVTEKYIAGHLRLIALKKRSQQRKG